MTRYRGGDKARAGFYWSPGRWEIVSVAKGGGALPGTAETRYLRLPLAALMIAGPLLGGLFVVFLPVIGFVMLFGFAAVKLAAICRRALAPLAAEHGAERKPD